jgi:hypothetical protein
VRGGRVVTCDPAGLAAEGETFDKNGL